MNDNQPENQLLEDKLKLTSLNISGIEVKMYGDAENPLFDC